MTTDFFKKHRWANDQVDWHFLILFDDQSSVQNLADKYRPHLKLPSLHPSIPNQWLHMTMLRVGPTDVINEKDMNRVCSMISQKIDKLTVPNLTIGPAWDWSGSVCLNITPTKELEELYSIIEASCSESLSSWASDSSQFIPHITLAYPKDSDVDSVQDKLDQLDFTTTAQPTKLYLVKQRQTAPFYSWEIYKEINLEAQ